MKIAIYPGTFDPITFGHIDIIKRAAEIFDHLIIAPAKDNYKNPMFTLDERVKLIEEEIKNLSLPAKISIEKFEGLLVEFARKKNAKVIIRGLRAVSDFEFEFQMFGMNSKLDSSIQTIFLPASETNHFIASRLVKEVAKLGGDVSKFVSANVAEKLAEKLKS
ncbi:MAG: pantetheine-phosphate adenylyltransferase [Alphaproteobacteria bacterium RIFCSPLOWO2_01_FULL_40_26]|nr:MAG: pantetheine-phosphate adenylyltransferase [Alphaproteobacteria bacterium RIFCSPHIGHO2_02_FULL_40_34]OFW88666.1 MAG: pantetheine-phosphate adenylyltransferase [Alphaproteobacteria bacterium RIFCSPHIGHO2_01_FULL_40_8]OFW94872.1 MAG: pantetheine-phosphate adenylyltransferase [Alphaproteobacteria bacterium RIFCSPLOWO2_01_FULL_40_26]OFX10498.1 MAG: pantetheine-phosphate adenylyltransferase [Alphaproteobacteria bacterium RIFCSPLOWO2_02_FULL_40_19]OFX10963.1 MAG: pantetheine-phosphate adenylyl